VCAFDSATCFRREIFSEYKLGRAAKEQGLVDALRYSFGASSRAYPTIGIEGFEADDILATVAAELSKSEKLWQSLLELKSRLPIVRQLVTLRTDVPGVAELLREGAIA
jgi:hypothetical protein